MSVDTIVITIIGLVIVYDLARIAIALERIAGQGQRREEEGD